MLLRAPLVLAALALCALLSAPQAAAQPPGFSRPGAAQEAPPRPDGKPADMSKPVQVYILMGQSNMLGFGKVDGLATACKSKGLYPYLVDESGSWTVRKDVRFVRVMCSGSGPSKTYNNEWMSVTGNFGPELGIGHHVGHVTSAPVLILKSCIGNRSLGYDLLPPNAEGYEGPSDPSKRPKSGPWYAGVQYDGDVAAAKQVLRDLGKHYPGAKRYEVAGFFWWQGDKDFRNAAHAASYEKNLICLIESLRTDFKAPDAKFVCATLGQTRKGSGGPQGQILEATLNIDGERGKYKAHKGKVASVYSHPLSKGGSSSGHYGGNAETYMNVGDAMGAAMARLIKNSPGAAVTVPGIKVAELDSSLKKAHKSIVAGRLSDACRSLRPYLEASSSKDAAQIAQARKLDEYVSAEVESALNAMQDFQDAGDFCQLRDALAQHRKGLSGLPAFDERCEVWAADLASEEGKLELAIGDRLRAIVARKERTSEAAYYGLISDFQSKHPDSFYALAAEEEVEPIRAALREVFAEIKTLGDRGDVYAKFMAIKEARSRFARIPEFDEADDVWKAEAKDPEVKASIAAGAAYEDIFEDVAKLQEQLESDRAKDGKISSPTKRAKAEAKTQASYLRKLKSLAGKLEKLGKKYGDTYFGRAASTSYRVYVGNNGEKLTDERGN